MRRIAVLLGWSESNPEYRSLIDTFVQGLAQLGWVAGRNVLIDVRWTRGDVRRMQTLVKELVELQPDVILCQSTPVTAALQRETRTIPIVFVIVADPVGSGFVAGLPRPGGNITGFINIEGEMGGKWLALLKEIAPRISRVAMMFNPDTAPGGGAFFLSSFEAAARSLAVEPITVRVRSAAEIEAEIASLGRDQAGLVLQSDSFLVVHQGTVISLAVRGADVWARSAFRLRGVIGPPRRAGNRFARSAGMPKLHPVRRGSATRGGPAPAPRRSRLVRFVR